jgi:hypothetical protein
MPINGADAHMAVTAGDRIDGVARVPLRKDRLSIAGLHWDGTLLELPERLAAEAFEHSNRVQRHHDLLRIR